MSSKLNGPAKRRTTYALTGVVAILLLISVAGCGGADSDEVEAAPGVIEPSSLPKREFVARANEICGRADRWLLKQLTVAMEADLEENPGKSEEDRFTDAVKSLAIPRLEATIRDVEALGAPPGDEAELEAFLTQLEQEVASLKAEDAIPMDASFEEAFDNSGALARDYGIDECAYG